MSSNLEKTFEKIGAKVSVVNSKATSGPAVRLNIITGSQGEMFEIAVLEQFAKQVDLSVLEVLPKDRHLVLLARETDEAGRVVRVQHFLCGHDERHLFVASVKGASTVAGAKESLKPREIALREVGVKAHKRNRRKTAQFKRQGEWFFVPEEIAPNPVLIRKYEPLVRSSGGKAHIAEFAYRTGGELVKVCREYPQGVTEAQYKKLIARNPRAARLNWQEMRRNMRVYVTGRIRHPDHATIALNGWHRVLMNTEQRTESVAFLD